MPAQSITITAQGDGSYAVAVTSAPGQPEAGPAQEVARSVEEVCSIVERALGAPDEDDPQAAWAAEAARRDETGRPAGPPMTLGA